MCCDSCPHSFCRACIFRNFRDRELQRILREADTWQCFVCDSTQMDRLRRAMAGVWKIPRERLPPPKPHPRYAHTMAAQVRGERERETESCARVCLGRVDASLVR